MVDYTNPGDVQTQGLVQASPTGATLEAPRTNSALQLAGALQGVNDKLPDALQAIGSTMQAKVAAKAHADAMANSGQAFADAVRAGKIEPTQSPWYIRAYNEQAAQVQGQAAVSSLVTDSQQWAERNDPTAYANRFNQELGKLAQQPQFQGIDGSTGFNKAALPLKDQALNQNTEYNVQRIQQENVQNATTLATKSIQDTLTANPKATPQQIWDATEDGHKTWLSTGGTEAQWTMLLKNSVYGAAANLGNANLIDILHDDRGGKGAIANIAGPDGKPVGAEIEQEKFWIERGQEAASTTAVRAHTSQVEQEGFQAQQSLISHFGDNLLFGKVPIQDLQTYARQQGFSVEAVQWATAQQAKALSESDTYSRAQVEQYMTSPTSAVENLKLHARAQNEGLTPALQGDVFDKVARGQMDLREGNQILQEADQTKKWLISQGRADKAEARSDARADRTFKLETARDLKQSGDTALSTVATQLHSVGDDILEKNKPVRDALDRTIRDAVAATYAKTNDPIAAQTAGEDAAGKWLIQRQKQRRPGQTPTGGLPGGNPRGNS